MPFISRFADDMSNSGPSRLVAFALPKLSFPGLARAYSTSSVPLFAGTLGCTTRKKESLPTDETGAKSLIGSYVLFLRMFGIAERTVYEARSSVYPSGADFATKSAAIAPSAPGRFSMKTGWPRACDSGGAMIRPTTSSAPPGGKGATTRTGLAGYWAGAVMPRSAPRMPSRVQTRRMLPPLRTKQSLRPAFVRAFQHLRIHDIDWLAGRVSEDLVKYV